MVWGKELGKPLCYVCRAHIGNFAYNWAATEIFIPNLTFWKQECGVKNTAITGENWHDLKIRSVQGSNTMTLFENKSCQNRDKGFLCLLITCVDLCEL